MIQLEENKGIPRSILIMMSVVAGLTVANLYYNQPLLEEMKASLGANEVETNLITVITQAGYAAGLLFVVPLADMLSRRKIIMTNMATAVLMALVIAFTADIKVVWAASFILGMCYRRYSYRWRDCSPNQKISRAIWVMYCLGCLRECWAHEW